VQPERGKEGMVLRLTQTWLHEGELMWVVPHLSSPKEWVPTSIGLVAADDGYVTKRNDKVAKDNIKRANTQRIPKASGNRRKSVNKRDSWYQGRQKKPSKII